MNTSRPAREPHPPITDVHDHADHDPEGPAPNTPPRPATPPNPDPHDADPHDADPHDADPHDPGGADDPLALSELIASADIDVVPGDPPVPITVWRVADVDAGWGHHADALSPRLAALLVGVRTRPGDTIVSIGDDPALAGAAGAGGRIYRSVPHPDQLADLDHAAGTVALIVLPWPPANRPNGMHRDGLITMLSACRRLMSPGGCTIIALAGLPPQQTFVQHSSTLIPAAQQAGLDWLQHIIAITAPIVGQHITWQAQPTDPAMLRAAAHLTVHLDLFVFVMRESSASSDN
ncbi:hypothetical protein [Dactylosporangium darangshiense]|uniref:hypothetical protein n=1 Tax=Dactylosporangium darangshiense TaxID=579108 RepID=UPI0031EC15D1